MAILFFLSQIDQQGSLLGDIGPIKSSLQTFEAQINAKVIDFDIKRRKHNTEKQHFIQIE